MTGRYPETEARPAVSDNRQVLSGAIMPRTVRLIESNVRDSATPPDKREDLAEGVSNDQSLSRIGSSPTPATWLPSDGV